MAPLTEVTEVPLPRLSLFSFEHPEEDAPYDLMYYGRLFVWKDDSREGETYKVPVTIRFDGSDEDLTTKMIDLIVGMGYQYGFTLTIVLDALREPIPELFLKAFDDK